jgi:hypothetical protein
MDGLVWRFIWTVNTGLLACRLIELGVSIVWVHRHGEGFALELSDAGKRASLVDPTTFQRFCQKHRRPLLTTEWPIERIILRLPRYLHAFLINFGYRLPTLIIGESLILCFMPGDTDLNVVLLHIGMSMTLLAIWALAYHVLANRVILGEFDHAYWLTTVVRRFPNDKIRNADLFPSRRRLVRKFVELFGWLLTVTFVGYAGLYMALVKTIKGAFDGIADIPDAFYFSVITLATVGYGDVRPVETIARLVVASEVIVGFALIVILLSSFNMTME